jgi:hypothetical protein
VTGVTKSLRYTVAALQNHDSQRHEAMLDIECGLTKPGCGAKRKISRKNRHLRFEPGIDTYRLKSGINNP